MNVVRTSIADVIVVEPRVFGDQRGFFYESFNANAFRDATGLERTFVQDNHSKSARGVLRGLHYQLPRPQGKLVRVTRGEVFDVAVDLRRSSPTFGQWVGEVLSEDNNRQLWVPEGFAHGFLVLSEFAEFLYKTTDFYVPAAEHCLLWNDPAVAISWPLEGREPLLSEKDRRGLPLAQAAAYA